VVREQSGGDGHPTTSAQFDEAQRQLREDPAVSSAWRRK
jgi:hypothetical protein